MIRQPIVIVVGHIDHGKSSLLEKIRGISITKGEAGGITQTLKSYTVPLQTIQALCGNLLENLKLKITIPGLLFLDSPGHAAFNNMRKRGGNLADIAILVIDINEGIKEQTLECIEILKQYKTPFIIALNKIDMVQGWNQQPKKVLVENINSQNTSTQEKFDEKLYTIVGKLSELGFQAERFDRVESYTKQLALVPISAKTGEGLPELLMLLTGLAQRFLELQLETESKGPGKATILEVKEEKGMGTILDIVLHDGAIKVNDQIVIGGLEKPFVTKVRAIFQGDSKKGVSIKEVHAAAGMRIVAPNVEGVIGGMPVHVANTNLEAVKKEVQKEIQEVLMHTDNEGIVIKADTLGSVEALTKLLQEVGIKIKSARIGEINKKDTTEAASEKDPLNQVILGFNITPIQHADVKVITSNIIYRIVEDYQKWKEEQKTKLELQKLQAIPTPCKFKILHGCIFRQSNPAVVGIQVIGGKIKANVKIMRQDGVAVGYVKSMQKEGENVNEVDDGAEAAVSIPNVVVGRQLKENDVLLSDLTEEDFMILKKLKEYLKAHEIEVLKEIALIKRKKNPVWGV